MRTTQFYIPHTDFWNWKLLSRTYIELQLKRAHLSYTETDNALQLLEERITVIQKAIQKNWKSANANQMWEYERQYKEVRQENKRLAFVRLKLRNAIDRMNTELENK